MVKYIKQGPRNARSQTHFHPHTTEERERVYVNKIERERKSICEQEKEEISQVGWNGRKSDSWICDHKK